MLSSWFILLLAQTDPYVIAAQGMELLARGEVQAALTRLGTARALAPDDFVILRDYAAAALRAGRLDDALIAIDRAIEMGDADPEAQELRAVILAERGELDEAIDVADATGTLEGAMIGAVLGDPHAAYRLVPLVDEASDRGALASLVLAANEGARGDLASARRLGGLSAKQALATDAFDVLTAARDLERKLADDGGSFRHLLRIRAGLDHATNPDFSSEPAAPSGLRAAFALEGAVEIPIGRALISGALRIDQHVFTTDRELYDRLDLTAFSVSTRVDLAVSKHPNSAILGFATRYVDVFARLFEDHYAASIEAGPDLTLQISAPMRLRLSFYGVATDFIDLSPPGGMVSSVNRDRVGQRAALTLILQSDWLAGYAEGLFLHDDARGDAFDAIGGALAGRVVAEIGGGVQLFTGIAVTVREYGPVGDRAIIGPASTRTEVRTVAQLGARVPLVRFERGGGVYFFMEDVWINDAARQGHAYTENVLSVGMEARL